MSLPDILNEAEPTENCLNIIEWETPATKYPLIKVGSVEICRIKQKAGYYYMEGVRGYDYYHHAMKIPVTCLKIGTETVMVDDPLHWIGMQDLAKAMKGKVLIAGLGLGLVLHALWDNKEVTEIHVIEYNKDVIRIMKNNMPKDDRIKIISDDFWNYVEKIGLNYTGKEYSALRENTDEQHLKELIAKQIEYIENHKIVGDYDTILMDIWWGKGNPKAEYQMFVLRTKLNLYMPNAKIMTWGLRNPVLNPGVTKVPNYEIYPCFAGK